MSSSMTRTNSVQRTSSQFLVSQTLLRSFSFSALAAVSHRLFKPSAASKLCGSGSGGGSSSGPVSALRRGMSLDLAAFASAYRITIASSASRHAHKKQPTVDPMVVEWIKHGFWVDPRRTHFLNTKGDKVIKPVAPMRVVSQDPDTKLRRVWFDMPTTGRSKKFGQQFERELTKLLWGPLCNLYALLSAHVALDTDLSGPELVSPFHEFTLTSQISGRRLFEYLIDVPELWEEDQDWMEVLVQIHTEQLEEALAAVPERLARYKRSLEKAPTELVYPTVCWTPPSAYVTDSNRVPTMPKSASRIPKSTLLCIEHMWGQVYDHCSALWEVEVRDRRILLRSGATQSNKIRVFCEPPSQ